MVLKIMRARWRTPQRRRPLSAKSDRMALERRLGVAGGAKKVRRPAAREVMCRLLARMTGQRRSVACTELTGRKSYSVPRGSRPRGGPQILTEDPLRGVLSASATRMFSSPKHTPLRVRLRPGERLRRSPSSRCFRRPGVCGQVPERFHGSNARRGARPGGGARSDNRIITSNAANPSDVCGAQANGRLREG